MEDPRARVRELEREVADLEHRNLGLEFNLHEAEGRIAVLESDVECLQGQVDFYKSDRPRTPRYPALDERDDHLARLDARDDETPDPYVLSVERNAA